MNRNDFDDILKKKLEEIPMENSMPDWDRMNKELEEDSIKDQMFDEQVNRKLQQLQVHNFARPSWNSLYELIDKRIQNKRRVIAAKSFEVIIVFLLFFTAFNTGIVDTPSQNTNKTNIAVDQLFADTQTGQSKLNELELDPTQQVVSTVANAEDSREKSYASAQIVALGTDFIPPSHSQNQYNSQALVRKSSVSTSFTQSNVSVNTSELMDDESTAHMANNSADAKLQIKQIDEIPTNIMEEAFPRNFASLTLPVLETEQLAQTFAYNNLAGLTATVPKKLNWFIGASVSLQNHEIESAAFKSIQNQGQRNVPGLLQDEFKQALGTAAGIQVGRKVGNAEFVSGFDLQRIKYSPDLILTSGTLSSFRETHVEEIQYDFISIPMEVNVALIGRKSWKARLHTGVVASFLLDAKEKISQTLIRGNRVTELDESLVDRSVLNYNFESGLLANDTPQSESNNVLDGMRYKANVGLSISKQLNRRTELFGRTDIYYQIPTSNNLQMNIDLINTVSFSFGVKQFLG